MASSLPDDQPRRSVRHRVPKRHFDESQSAVDELARLIEQHVVLIPPVDGGSDSDMEDYDIAASNDGDEAPDVLAMPPVVAAASGGQIGWSENIRLIEKAAFDGPEHSHGVHELTDQSSRLDFFNLFFTNAMFERIATESNEYHRQQHQNEENPPDPLDVDADELKLFFGCMIALGIGTMPDIETMFNENDFGSTFVKTRFSKHRFQQIYRYLHFVNNERDQNEADKLWKLRWFIDSANQSFQQHLQPAQNLAVDESMVASKACTDLKQYMPKKPIKYGFKIWTLADSETGYCLGFDVYTGKAAVAANQEVDEIGLSGRVVTNLTNHYFGHHHNVYFDNFFTSYGLVQRLLQHQTYSCGTARANRIGWPSQFRAPHLPRTGELRRGDSRILQNSDGTTCAYLWQDRKMVSLMDTTCSPLETAFVSRHLKNSTTNRFEAVRVKCPQALKNYTENYAGVDKFDRLLESYQFYRRSSRWYLNLSFHIINSMLVNAYILWKLIHPSHRNEHGHHLEWRKQVALELVAGKCSRKLNVPPQLLLVADPNNSKGHYLRRDEPPSQHFCQICSQKLQAEHILVHQSCPRSTYKCCKCNIYLCVLGCYETHLKSFNL